MKKMVTEKRLLALSNEEVMNTFGGYAPPEREEPEIGDPDYIREMMKWYQLKQLKGNYYGKS